MCTQLSAVIKINENRCINCHQCISVCPVKFCNDGSNNYIHINPDLCIGCGECLKACTHGARSIIDDLDLWLEDLKSNQRMVAIVAPAVASNFPNKYLHLNGWLKSVGIKAIFDVSFGAELTIKSYLEHIQKNKPKCVIAQPCPAIVNYIEIYHPELIKFLAPADSPMVHTLKIVRNFYPQYSDYKVVIISPCIGKKREFEEVGVGDYNVTMKSLDDYFNEKNISLTSYPAIEYDNPPAERGVLFSSPGGLMRTAYRENPEIINHTRKIEGPETIYHYLNDLISNINKGTNPLLIDCLNCEAGCNGGTGTQRKVSLDYGEYLVEERKQVTQKKYLNRSGKKIICQKAEESR